MQWSYYINIKKNYFLLKYYESFDIFEQTKICGGFPKDRKLGLRPHRAEGNDQEVRGSISGSSCPQNGC